MDSRTIQRIKHHLSANDVRRKLIKFFVTAGYTDSFDRLIYPAVAGDIPKMIPQIADKIDIEPHAIDINPVTNTATLGWNLYVLGSHRMFLGETKHSDLRQLAQDLKQGNLSKDGTAVKQTTPRKIVNFVVHVLGKSESGYVDPNVSPNPVFSPKFATAISPNMSPKYMGSAYRGG